ncbi:zinc-binding dehydrogenase [Anaerolineae bacterium CFX9]|nr:alcohol dehydrogenase catalytic domain-containing protein [Kamptonema cortianum]MDL1901436.1 zinc-binding dehydrogenase [Anaerolineae bacterium CFX9]
MLAARLYGMRNLRVEEVPEPPPPAAGEVQIRVGVVGICGSDLHSYLDGRIGDTRILQPLILGHEFGGTIVQVGGAAHDGADQPVYVGQRVAVDPATPCWRCEFCEAGHPNLCRRLHFCGLYPDHGSLCERMNVPARSCFPVPDSLSDAGAALLEPLGVALHAVDLAKLRLADTVVVLGCGMIGLLIVRLARLSGVNTLIAFDKFAWRAEKARQWGASHVRTLDQGDPMAFVHTQTNGRGADVVIEAAWADESIAWAAEMARLGGRLVLVGIPSEDRLTMKHSTARRKGLTIRLSRRMKHTYPRAIQLVEQTLGPAALDELITHRFALSEAAEAFATNTAYPEGLIKAVIDVNPPA